MNIKSRKPLIAALALTAALSAPMAFAQSASEQAPPGGDAAAPAAAAQDPAATAAPAPSAPKKSWADVDTDKSGNLSKGEAAAVPALSQVFEQADTDANGQLTPDEYKNYVAKAQSGGGAASGKSGGK
ncbi:EF-hand domain-containing protein [Lysobacter sp. K5869]|uniref:EF-hand domain-containing protein n=1 Tax=Lysobacter sp. K5869 TaxID=2820808 RepID=UPI001C0625F6|nr:EF-hand domain-containing protein [Lysobacter sp. K5869]QWP78444.1 EF-hand domain-containing protein [Lysobacter sp. K5869]